MEQVCDQPGPPPANDPMPLHLGQPDRGRAAATFDQMAQSIAGYEASAEVTTFTSKFDAVLAGKAQFTPQEQAGYDLFRGKAQCNACHRDGGPGEDPLFTDFTASNIGTPANPRLPFYTENRPDARGYVANPAGSSFVDGGVGAFLTKGHPLSQPSAIDTRWHALALGYEGSGANIARTIYRLEAGRSILKPIGRLLEMFDAFGVPLAWAGERAERQHNDRPRWSPAGALASEGKFLEATLHAMPLKGEPPSYL